MIPYIGKNNMKKHFLILLSCLFLTGCDLPSFSSGSESAAPSVSESEKVTVEVPSISEATVSKEPSVSEEPSLSEEEDPYINRSEEQFYANYTPAVSYQDSVYRTKHYFRSGDLGPLPYIPPKAEYQPKFGDTYIRNTDYQYTDNGNGYLVYDGNGNVIKTIYKGGAYITPDDVCAYVMAFGNKPSNYTSAKRGVSPSKDPWGKYLRLNFSSYSNSRPDEVHLPTGDNNDYKYMERDIGGASYNTGKKISRDTFRLIFSYKSGKELITEVNSRYVFLTADHYHTFYEYLNYQGGYGENITFQTKYIPTVNQGLAA